MNSIEIKPTENRVDIQHAGNDITVSTCDIFTTAYFLSPFQPAERHEEVKK
jgi:hypothetical protein